MASNLKKTILVLYIFLLPSFLEARKRKNFLGDNSPILGDNPPEKYGS